MSNSVFVALYIYLFLNLRALLLHPHPLFTIESMLVLNLSLVKPSPTDMVLATLAIPHQLIVSQLNPVLSSKKIQKIILNESLSNYVFSYKYILYMSLII